MIALCEDNERDKKLILDMLDEWEHRTMRKNDVKCFAGAGELLDSVLGGGIKPDILLRDIYFEGQDMTGVEAVRELRKAGIDAEIIFLTTSEAHSLEAWGLNARQYLVKPVEKERLFDALDKCVRERPRSIVVKQRGGAARKIFCGDILYCETRGNEQIIRLNGGEEAATRMSSVAMRGTLSDFPEFVNLGPSYIINLLRVVSLEEDSVILEGGSASRFPTSVSWS